jgi:hypothetical protein
MTYFLISAFLLISAFHLFWGIKGISPHSVFIPSADNKHLFSPSKLSCFLIGLIFLIGAMHILMLEGIIPPLFSQSTMMILNRIISAVFLLRAIGEFRYIGFFKKIRGTRFAKYDDRFFSPLCMAIALCLLLMTL